MIDIEKPKRERERERERVTSARQSFRTLEIVAVTLAVCAMAAGVIYWQTHGTIGTTIPIEFQLKVPKENVLYSKNVTATTTEYAYISTEEATGEFIWRDQFSNTKIVSQKGNQVTANVYGRDMFYQNGGKSYKIDIATTTTEAFTQQTKLSFIEWLFGQKAYASNVTAYDDGTILGPADATYATTRDATSGTVFNNNAIIGQEIPSTYSIYRSFYSFAIPNMTTLTAASLFVNGNNDSSTTDFNVYILTSTYSSYTGSEYDVFDGHQATGAYNGTALNNAWSTASYSANWNELVFTAGGRTAILAQKNGTFKMAAISSRDYASTTPTGAEYLSFKTSTTAGEEPYLSITYTLPPTVTTQSASSVTATTATLNGNITAVGSPAPTVRGFAWGTNSALSGGDTATTTWDTGTFGTGAFTDTTLTFVCNTTYYSRAYATNTGGTGLGAISASFTTSACANAPTVTTQSASLITDTTATLNGNITNTGTANVTVRGFAYGIDSTLATVISTTTDTTGQPFSTGAFTAAITGLTKGTNYYARAYATNSVGTGLGSIQALTSNLQSDVIIFRNNVILNNNVILK